MLPGTYKRASVSERFFVITIPSFSLAMQDRAAARLEPMKPAPPVITNFLDMEKEPWKKCDILEIIVLNITNLIYRTGI